MLPRCYRFDGSTGMDLRPAAVLEAEDARRTELRRRHEPMAVTTRIRMVGQPPGGLLPLSLFDHVPLADRMGLHPRSMFPCWVRGWSGRANTRSPCCPV